MTTCKQPKSQEDLTPHPPHQGSGSLRGKGGQERGIDQTTGILPVPSPLRGGLGRGYLYLLQKSISAKSSKSSGFTIIECLLAIILVGILMTAIAPVIVLSVATRLQARRVEQATMAARTYIDGVQTGAIPPPGLTVLLEENQSGTFTSNRENFASGIAAPNSTPISCPDDRASNPNSSYPYCAPARPNLFCVDNDGGGCTSGSNRDFIVQAFRSVTTLELDPSDGTPKDKGEGGYVLGVRVYRADAFDGTSVLTTTKLRYEDKVPTKIATNTGGRGQRNAPMIELTTEVRPNVPRNSTLVTPVPGVPTPDKPEAGDAMNKLCARLGGCVDPTAPPTTPP